MQKFVDFLANNYMLFLLISLVLVFALIGYLVDSKKKEKIAAEKEKGEVIVKEEVKEVTLNETVTPIIVEDPVDVIVPPITPEKEEPVEILDQETTEE